MRELTVDIIVLLQERKAVVSKWGTLQDPSKSVDKSHIRSFT